VVLLTTLAIGGGSAIAGVSEVRDAFRSVFGATVAPSDAATDDVVPEDFGFGPLGDMLSLEKATHRVGRYDAPARSAAKSARARSTRGKATRGDDRRRGAGSGPDRGNRKAALHGTGGTGGTGGSGLQNTPPRTTAPGPGPAPSDPAPTGSREPAPSPTPAPDTHPGNGRALGHSLPTPRRPAQPGPQRGGRTDPPALGRNNAPNGKSKGNSK
jgi:hypothetical protein